MPTPKHLMLAKIIIWHQNVANSQAMNMQASLTSRTLYNHTWIIETPYGLKMPRKV